MISHYHFFFFFNDTATTEIYTLSLHDALPISRIDNSRSSFSLFGGKRSVRLARRSCSAGREGESAPLRGGSPRKAPHTHIDTDEPLMNARRSALIVSACVVGIPCGKPL